MEKHENLKKLVKALDGIVKEGEDIMEDGKLSFEDADDAMAILPHAKAIYEVVQEKDGLLEELKAWAEEKLEELKS